MAAVLLLFCKTGNPSNAIQQASKVRATLAIRRHTPRGGRGLFSKQSQRENSANLLKVIFATSNKPLAMWYVL
jgi:hypothetical protein